MPKSKRPSKKSSATASETSAAAPRAKTAKSSPAKKASASSLLRFDVNPSLPEVRALALQQGWVARGFTELSVASVEVLFTTNDWESATVLKSTTEPSPYRDGCFTLPGVKKGTPVEFAVKATIACASPDDASAPQAQAVLWFNNRLRNYTQIAE